MKPGDVVADRFEILRLAGSGGMGSVWRAKDRIGGGDVALKVVHTPNAADSERLRREATVLAEMEHARVVRYVAHGITDENLPFLAMEWLDGETLEDRMIRRGLQVGEALIVCRGIAEGLAALHSRGFLHRDVKPSNVCLVGCDIARVKLLDLGIARLPMGARRATLTGTAIGTPGYMAPEQARGAKALDARVDVFALGCVLFECLTGMPAFVGESAMAVLAKVLFEEPPRVMAMRDEDIPPEIEAFVGRLMAKAPEMRLADGAAVLAAMDALPAVAIIDGSDVGPPTSILPGRAITGGERKLVSVVMAMVPEPVADPASAPTLASGSPPARRTDVHATAQAHGAEVEQLAMGVVVATIRGREGASDQALAAARCALALRALLPHAAMAIATGLGELANRIPMGEAIDRATKLIELGVPDGGDPKGIRIDETTTGLLPGSFGVTGDVHGLVLAGMREDAMTEGAARTLLGKPTPFVGREREVSTVMGIARQCFEERVARACLVIGAAGAGKSRLRAEIVRSIKDDSPGTELWVGRADGVSRGSPFSVLAQIVRSAMNLGQGESLALRQQKLRARVARRARPSDDPVRIGSFLGELADVPFPDDIDVRLRAARGDTIVMGDQIRRAFDEWIASECERGPVAIVLEDLHWGDLPSVELLDAVLRRNAERPLLVLAFARPEIADSFPGLWRERDVQELRLAPLTKRASEKLVRDLLPKAEHEDIARIVDRAAGNPFYVEELVRAYASGGALPLTVLAMIEARFERLDAETRRVLRAASVFGQRFWRSGVVALLGGATRAAGIDDHLGSLEREEIASRHPISRFSGEQEWGFRHALVRDAAEATLTEDDARTAHGLCAEWLEDHGETDAVQLADHHERGANGRRAAMWLCRAAREALEGNDYAAAIERAKRAIDAGADGELLGDALVVTCEAHVWRDENEAAVAAGLRALDELERGNGAWVLACGDVALGAHRAGNDAQVKAIGTMLMPVVESIVRPEPSQLIGVARVASRLFAVGALEAGDRLLGFIDQRSKERESDAVIGAIHSARAMRAAWTGSLSTEIGELREASLAFEAAGDVRNAAYSLHNAGYALCDIGELEAGESALHRAMRLADPLGLRGIVFSCKANLGIARSRAKDYASGIALEREAIEGFRALRSRRDEATARIYLGIILRNLPGEMESAEREVRGGIAILPDSPVLHAAAYGALATVLNARGKKDEALAATLEGQRLFERAGGVVDGESLCRLAFAEALHAAGRIDEARAAIAKAKTRLDERAARIDDARWRKSFLERIGEHARTLARFEEWG